MNTINNFIRANQIDSFQKLHFLLFFQQNPKMKGTSQELTERLYFGNTLLLEEIIIDLHKAGLLVKAEHCWQLSDEPDVRANLQHLAKVFEDPLRRQKLLEQIRGNVSFSRYH